MDLKILFDEQVLPILKQPEIIAVFLSSLLWLLSRVFLPRAKIIYGISHGFSFRIPQTNGSNSLILNTGSIIVKSIGRSTAKEVEFYFNYKPDHFEIWPVVIYHVENAPDGRFIIKFPFLKKGEHVNIELIHERADVPNLLSARALEGECKEVNIAPLQLFSKPVNYGFLILSLIGGFVALIWLVKIIQYLIP